MTDIASYVNLLFATIGQPRCPRSGEPTPSRSASQILEAILALPASTEIELRAPVFKVYGEDLDVVFTEVRKKGCRASSSTASHRSVGRIRARECKRAAHGRGRRPLRGGAREAIRAGVASTARRRRAVRVHLVKGASKAEAERFYRGFCSPTHHFVYGDIRPEVLHVQQSGERVRLCGGLGVDKLTHPDLLVPDVKRSISDGLLRERSLSLQPGDLGRHADVQPVEGARPIARRKPWKGPARARAPRRSMHDIERRRSS